VGGRWTQTRQMHPLNGICWTLKPFACTGALDSKAKRPTLVCCVSISLQVLVFPACSHLKPLSFLVAQKRNPRKRIRYCRVALGASISAEQGLEHAPIIGQTLGIRDSGRDEGRRSRGRKRRRGRKEKPTKKTLKKSKPLCSLWFWFFVVFGNDVGPFSLSLHILQCSSLVFLATTCASNHINLILYYLFDKSGSLFFFFCVQFICLSF